MEIIVQKTTVNNITTGVKEVRVDVMAYSGNTILVNKKAIVLTDENEAILTRAEILKQSNFNAAVEELKKLKNEFESFKAIASTEFVKQFKAIDSNYNMNLTYKGVAIPQPIVDKMTSCKTKEEALRIHRFFLKCLDNPNSQSVKDLFLFIEKSQLIITPSGNFVTFRRIVSRKKVSDTTFNLLSQMNATLIKNPGVTLYGKIEGDNLVLTTPEVGKPMRDLIQEIGSNTSYTDARTGKFDYRIGYIYQELNYDANHENTCSRGLHSGSLDYVNNWTGFGDTIVWCIVNPTKVVAVSDSASKVRSSELYIGGLVTGDLYQFAENFAKSNLIIDSVDEEYEKKYEGRVIAYASTEKESQFCIKEDDYEDEDFDYAGDDYDKVFDDEDELTYEEELEEENDELKKENRKLKEMIEEIKQRLNING